MGKIKASRKGAAALAAALLVGAATGCSAPGPKEGRAAPLLVTFYYDSPCEGCRDEEEFYALFDLKTQDIRERLDVRVSACNTFSKAGHARWQEGCGELGLPEEERQLPMVIAGKGAISGEKAIQQRLRLLVCQQAGIADGKTFWYYYRPACPDCTRIQEQLDSAFHAHPELSLIRTDTTDEKEKAEFKALLADREVPDGQWQVPFLFDWEQQGYLSGWKEIQEGLDAFLNLGEGGPGQS